MTGTGGLGGSIEAEERAMRSGKGGMIAGAIVAVLAIGGLAAYLLVSGDDKTTYREFGKTVNGLHGSAWLEFWTCALQSGAQYDRLRNNLDLKAALDQRAERGGGRYGALLRDRCMTHLGRGHDALAALLPPPDLQEDVRALQKAVTDLRGAMSEYIAFLDAQGTAYDPESSGPAIDKIARAWFEYKQAFNALNRKLREKIQG
jgi:hypothetical protein